MREAMASKRDVGLQHHLHLQCPPWGKIYMDRSELSYEMKKIEE